MSTPAEGLFPDLLERAFTPAPEFEELADELIATLPEFRAIDQAKRDGLVIHYVWETKPFDPEKDDLKPHVIAKVTKASPLWKSITDYHLVIQFRRWFWDRFDEQQRAAVTHHELSHIDVDEPDDQGRIPLSLRPHSVEDFTGTMRRYGPVIPGRREFIKAAMDWARENRERPAGEATEDPTPLYPDVAAIVDAVAELPVEDQVKVHEAAEHVSALHKLAQETGTEITITHRPRGGEERTVTINPRADGRFPCPVDGCTSSTENEASMPAHIAMAHPEIPMDDVAPKREAETRPTLGDALVDQGTKYRIREIDEVPGRASIAQLAAAGPNWKRTPVVAHADLSQLELDKVAGVWRGPTWPATEAQP